MSFNPNKGMLGGYRFNDGTIEFYGRINSVLRSDMVVLDLGAGRAEWYEDDPSYYRKSLRLLKGKVSQVIATDVDRAVLNNRACDIALVMEGNRIPIGDASVDLVVADWVLEHVEDPLAFRQEIDRILRPGGFFCARTPHGASYLSVAARLVGNAYHTKLLKFIQPGRKAQDVFPTLYRMNTLRSLRKQFSGYEDFCYVFRPEPAYFFGVAAVYHLQSFFHRVMPSFVSGCLFVFLKRE